MIDASIGELNPLEGLNRENSPYLTHIAAYDL